MLHQLYWLDIPCRMFLNFFPVIWLLIHSTNNLPSPLLSITDFQVQLLNMNFISWVIWADGLIIQSIPFTVGFPYTRPQSKLLMVFQFTVWSRFRVILDYIWSSNLEIENYVFDKATTKVIHSGASSSIDCYLFVPGKINHLFPNCLCLLNCF